MSNLGILLDLKKVFGDGTKAVIIKKQVSEDYVEIGEPSMALKPQKQKSSSSASKSGNKSANKSKMERYEDHAQHLDTDFSQIDDDFTSNFVNIKRTNSNSRRLKLQSAIPKSLNFQRSTQVNSSGMSRAVSGSRHSMKVLKTL